MDALAPNLTRRIAFHPTTFVVEAAPEPAMLTFRRTAYPDGRVVEETRATVPVVTPGQFALVLLLVGTVAYFACRK
jgi:hypothetical protein